MDLFEYVGRRQRPLPFEEALELWRTAVAQVRTLTDEGTFHGRLRVRSFEIDPERSTPSLHVDDRDNIVGIAQGGEAVETAPWPMAAPEQTGLVAGSPGPASNIYNLGVLGYFLLSGRFPFEHTAGPHLSEEIVRNGIPLVNRNDLDLPTGELVNRIVRRATEQRPEDRYPSMAQLEAEIALLLPHVKGTLASRRPPLVGREITLKAVADTIDEARGGASSERLLVIGEPGIGKTFLWRAAEAMFQKTNEWWIYTKVPQTGGVPYAGYAALIENLLTEQRFRQQEVLRRLLADHGVSDRGIQLGATIVPKLGSALGINPGQSTQRVEPPLPTDTSELAAILFALSKNQTLTVVAIDDLQWLDEQSVAVLQVLLRAPHPSLALVMLGRKEARRLISPDVEISELPLTGLGESACYELLRLLSAPDQTTGELSALNRTVIARAQGNPLATINLLQVFRRGADHRNGPHSGVAVAERPDKPVTEVPEMKMLEVLAHDRMTQVGPECRRLVHHLSLLLPPVSLDLVERIPSFNGSDLSALFDEAEGALLLSVDRVRGEVWFFHDSVESTARSEAVEDQSLIASTALLLYDVSRDGDPRASFALARLLSSEILDSAGSDGDQTRPRSAERRVYEQIPAEDAVRVLEAAAVRALDVSVPSDALRFSHAALKLCCDSNHIDRTGRCLPLHRIAHRAAYSLDNVYAMSRSFDQIRASGTDLDISEARQLWIARTYSKAMFAGSVRIALQVFQSLDALPPNSDPHRLIDAAREYLRTTNPRRLFRRLMRARYTQNPRTALILNTIPRLILPAIEVDRPLLPVLAYLIIRESLRDGVSDYTALAFVIWAVMEGMDGTFGTYGIHLYSLSEYARVLASRSVDPIARHSILTCLIVFSATGRKPFSEVLAETFELYLEGERIANFESAMDALHIHAQGLLSSGVPLDEVFRTIGDYRERMSARKFDRDARALAKFQQAAEALAGRTDDPLRLSGSVCDEERVLRAIQHSGDSMSVGGFYYLKAMLAVFADRPDLAVEYSHRATVPDATMPGLHEDSLIQFYRGMSAFRTGAPREGSVVLERFRRWSRFIPETHEHRYFALLAERAAARGMNARAARLLARARRTALTRGYPHEAALFAERQGDILQASPGGSAAAAEPLHLAQSLYTQWGAMPAADRVRKKLSWAERPYVFSPVLSDEQFLGRLTSAGSSSELLRIGLEELSRFSAAESAYLTLSPLGESSSEANRFLFVQEWTDSITSVVTQLPTGELPSEVGRIFGELRAGDTCSATTAFGGGTRSFLALRSDPSASLSIRVCLIARAGAPSFSSFVAARAKGALLLTASLLQLRENVETVAAQAEALKVAREELLRTQEYSRVLFETLPDAFFLVDRNGTLLFRNRSADAYVARPERVSEDPGRSEEEPLVPQIVWDAIDRINAQDAGSAIESQLGDRYLRILAVQPQTGPTSSLDGVYAVSVSDITGQKRQEEAFRRQEQQLIVSDRLASIGMLASTIAHEVSNPNYILQLNAQALTVLLNQWRSRHAPVEVQSIDEAERLVALITEGTQQIEEVVQQVKQYGREGHEEEWEVVPPAAICERALRFSRIMAAQYTDHLSFEPGSEAPPVRAARGRLEQALVNLIKNACESLADPSGRVVVQISFDSAESEVAISVLDTGRGIPRDLAHRLGHPFTSARAREGGTGLGLSIVQTILDHHGGRLQVSPGVDGFTTCATMFVPCWDRSASSSSI